MFQKRISRLIFTFFASSVLYASPYYGVEQAAAINNLMELFSKKQKPAPVLEMQPESGHQSDTQGKAVNKSQNTVPGTPQGAPAKKNNIDLTNRVTVASPKTFNYRPERLVPIEFSNIDFIETNSTMKSSGPARLPLSEPYNVILEGVNSGQNTDIDQSSKSDFSHIDVKIEDSIAGSVTRHYVNKPDLMWSVAGEVTDKAIDVMRFLARVDEDGLEPQDYFVKLPDENLVGEERNLAFTNFDVALTSRVLRYIQDASNGRIIADRLSPFHDLPRRQIDFEKELGRLATSENPVADLEAYLPQSDSYKALKHALAQMPKSDHADNVKISFKTVIKPGETNEDLPLFTSLLLKRAPSGYLSDHRVKLERFLQETSYNAQLVECVRDYQKFVGKTADGVIGPATVATLANNTVETKRQKIIDSMERLRWLPHDFGSRYVFINQAAYRGQYVENNAVKLDMKVVVGSPQRQTYFFYDKIRLVTFNPSWGVPHSIVVNEMLPRIMQDSGYLQRNNYELYDSSGRVVSASSVNWQQVANKGRGISIRQTPGKNNALGELKILFPNKHDIYLHDTPNKTAFSRDMRALSHGCVRLEYPREMAAAVLGKNVDDLKPYFAKGERSLSLSEPVPVYLTYFTAWPDPKSGKINYYDDIYGRDALMAGAVAKTESVRKSDI